MSRPHVFAVVQLPPPVTGLSAVNARMVEALELSGALLGKADVAPPPGVVGIRKLVFRAGRTAKAIYGLFTAKARGATVLYMPSDSAAGLVLNILVLLVARFLGYRVWMHHHNFSYVSRRSALMAALLRLSPRGTGHIALCEDMLEQFAARYAEVWSDREHHGLTLPNAFMIEKGKPQHHALPGELTIGHLSNLTVEKGAVRFIKLFITLRQEGLPIKAQLAGPIGDSATAEAIDTARRMYPDAFSWLGPIYGDEKVSFYRSIDVFVFPSQYVNEAQPLVLLEALAQGAAILTTERGCMRCDHRDSPGMTAPEAEFEYSALAWLRDHMGPNTRLGMRAVATECFDAMKAGLEGKLQSVIAQI